MLFITVFLLYVYAQWIHPQPKLGLMHLSTLNNVNPLGHPAILSTDGQYLQECRNPSHNACNKALATWPWLTLLLVKENPDDQNLSLLWTTFLHLFCGCSFVTISNFNASDSTYHFSPRALSRGSVSLSRFYSFQSLAMCSSFCSLLADFSESRFQWELEPLLRASSSNSYQHKSFFWLFPQPLARSEHDCPLLLCGVHN